MIAQLLALASLLASTHGFPSGPGSCNSPNPLGGFHLAPGFDGGGPLSDFGLEVRIGGDLLDPATPYELTVGTEKTIELTSSGNNQFRGFLVKVSSPGLDATDFLASDEADLGIQQLFLCDSQMAGSLAHRDNGLKDSIQGTIFVNEEMDDVTLEVTAVIRNGVAAPGSEWYLSIYSINVVAAAPVTGGVCFPGDAVAQVQDKGPVAMKNLQLGDSVLTDVNTFEPIYSFGHADAKASSDFVQLKTSKTTLELTKDHMVFVEGDRAVPASSIRPGDNLITESGALEAVKTIKEVVRRGNFAPFTPSGSIVVNGVKSSSFVAFQDSDVLQIGGFSTGITYQWIAHAAETPHRVWCHYLGQCKSEQYTADGISTWVAVPHKMALWFVNQNALVMAVVSVPVVLSFASLWMVDVLMAFPMTIMALLVAARFFSVRVKKDVKL